MGSHLFAGLARTGRYRELVAMLGDSAGGGGGAGVASLAEIASVTLDASLSGLERAKADEGLAYCFYLLVRVTRAAREPNLLTALARIGVPTPAGISGLPDVPIPLSPDEYGLYDLTSGFAASADRHVRVTRTRTDLAELAQLAAAESLSALCGPAQARLFVDGGASGVKRSLKALSTRNGFAHLAHDFFARLVRRYLEYHLSRELPNHVGPGRRFRHVDEHNDFLRRLDDHCRVATGVMRDFAGGWYSLHNFRGDVSVDKAKAFCAHAVDKVRGALAYQESRDRTTSGGTDGRE